MYHLYFYHFELKNQENHITTNIFLSLPIITPKDRFYSFLNLNYFLGEGTDGFFLGYG